ncbi:MAG: threonine ammonia-lyase [Dehalococcoidia bacterium]|nr:threonine ammonia-lyase [Dehalococcoidia bacterium]
MVTLEQIMQAQRVVEGHINHTPVLTSASLSKMAGCELFLKAENLQRTGSFKVRGAINKLSSLTSEQRTHGVVAASAGNHAQGVAIAALNLGIPATIVMPEGASLAKVAATRGYGADVILHGRDFDEAAAHARQLREERSLTLIPAFDDELIIAGQGTIGLELVKEAPDMEMVVVPVGGGGLISGIALAIKGLLPHVKIVGVQSSSAPAAAISYRSKTMETVRPGDTIADGIAVGKPGELTLPMMLELVDDMVQVDDEEISQAMVLLLECCKLVVEGAGAVGVAALLSGKVPCQGSKVVSILSGVNIDVSLLDKIVEHGLTTSGRYLVLRVNMQDRPGRLSRLLDLVADSKGNIMYVEHHRTGLPLPMGTVQVELTVETRNSEHTEEICQALTRAGYSEEAAGTRPPLQARILGSAASRPLVRSFIEDTRSLGTELAGLR